MDKKEAIIALQAKSTAMIAFFKDRPLPTSPLCLTKGEFIIDVPKFINSQVGMMRDLWDDPFHKLFILSYKRLERLKKHLEN